MVVVTALRASSPAAKLEGDTRFRMASSHPRFISVLFEMYAVMLPHSDQQSRRCAPQIEVKPRTVVQHGDVRPSPSGLPSLDL